MITGGDHSHDGNQQGGQTPVFAFPLEFVEHLFGALRRQRLFLLNVRGPLDIGFFPYRTFTFPVMRIHTESLSLAMDNSGMS